MRIKNMQTKRKRSMATRIASLAVVLSMVTPGITAMAKTVQIEGGTWDYGTSLGVNQWTKYSWSSYYHPDKKHGSSVQVGSTIDRDDRDAGATSYASLTTYITQGTAHAYYRIND